MQSLKIFSNKLFMGVDNVGSSSSSPRFAADSSLYALEGEERKETSLIKIQKPTKSFLITKSVIKCNAFHKNYSVRLYKLIINSVPF